MCMLEPCTTSQTCPAAYWTRQIFGEHVFTPLGPSQLSTLLGALAMKHGQNMLELFITNRWLQGQLQ